jgi:lysozyme
MTLSTSLRVAVGAMTLGAGGLVSLALYEGYEPTARPPVKGDVPTVGFGSTRHADGTPVVAGEVITPPRALALMARDVRAKEGVLKTCLGDVALTQDEYDALVSLAYNVGPSAVCRSSIPAKLKAGDYAAACRTILDFKRVQGRDCSLPANKRFCGGIWTRRQAEAATCLGSGA